MKFKTLTWAHEQKNYPNPSTIHILLSQQNKTHHFSLNPITTNRTEKTTAYLPPANIIIAPIKNTKGTIKKQANNSFLIVYLLVTCDTAAR